MRSPSASELTIKLVNNYYKQIARINYVHDRQKTQYTQLVPAGTLTVA